MSGNIVNFHAVFRRLLKILIYIVFCTGCVTARTMKSASSFEIDLKCRVSMKISVSHIYVSDTWAALLSKSSLFKCHKTSVIY